jgi:hypothetical protein
LNINFTVSAEDFLNHQLFIASRSERIRKKRAKLKYTVPVLYLLFGVVLLLGSRFVLGGIMVGVSILWYLFYPKWERTSYVKHYKNVIDDYFKDNINSEMSVDLQEDVIHGVSNGTESRLETKGIQEFVEAPTAFYILLSGGQSIILPKQNLQDEAAVKAKLQAIAAHVQIPFEIALNWTWQ